MNLASYPNLSRAYEIALNGGFTIGLTADLDMYPEFTKDLPVIKEFFDRAWFTRNADIMVDLVRPHENNHAESLQTLYARVDQYANDKASADYITDIHLDSTGTAILKTAKERLSLSLKQVDNVKRIAAVISNMERSQLIEACHVAEAVNYVYTHDRLEDEAKTTIMSIIEQMDTAKIDKVIEYALTLL